MNVINLKYTIPQVFSGQKLSSDIWGQDVVFEKGYRYLIEAASGTGKSSLCSFIYGYRNDFLGDISFDGRSSSSLTREEWRSLRTRSLTLLFQELRLFPELTAFENVMVNNNLTNHRTRAYILDMFDRLGLSDRVNTPLGILSYGQRQRVAFIRMLCQPSDFILMDEPVSHLDRDNAAIMADIINEEIAATGAGLVVTSIGNRLNMQYDKIFRL